MSESESFPYAPEGADKIGKPPVEGKGGERGSSAYDGDEAKGFGGPASGVEYYEAQHPTAINSATPDNKPVRESANKE